MKYYAYYAVKKESQERVTKLFTPHTKDMQERFLLRASGDVEWVSLFVAETLVKQLEKTQASLVKSRSTLEKRDRLLLDKKRQIANIQKANEKHIRNLEYKLAEAKAIANRNWGESCISYLKFKLFNK